MAGLEWVGRPEFFIEQKCTEGQECSKKGPDQHSEGPVFFFPYYIGQPAIGHKEYTVCPARKFYSFRNAGKIFEWHGYA